MNFSVIFISPIYKNNANSFLFIRLINKLHKNLFKNRFQILYSAIITLFKIYKIIQIFLVKVINKPMKMLFFKTQTSQSIWQVLCLKIINKANKTIYLEIINNHKEVIYLEILINKFKQVHYLEIQINNLNRVIYLEILIHNLKQVIYLEILIHNPKKITYLVTIIKKHNKKNCLIALKETNSLIIINKAVFYLVTIHNN